MRQIKNIQEKPLIFEAINDDGKDFWIVEYNYNALFKIDKISKEAQFIGNFPGEKIVQSRLYISMTIWNKKIYFAPFTAKEIAVYDIQKNKFYKLKITCSNKNNFIDWEKGKFHRIVEVKGKIYFIPFYYPGLLCYDTKTDKFSCFDDWVDDVEKIRKNEWGYFLEFTFVNEKLFLPCACAGAVVIFDTILQTSIVMVTQSEAVNYPCIYCGISYINDCFYLLSADGSLLKRKLESDKEKEEKIILPVCGDDTTEFYLMKYIDNYIYFFPFKKNICVKMNIETKQIMEEKLFDDEHNYKGNECLFLTALISDNELYLMTGNSRRFLKYNLENKTKEENRLYLSEQDYCLIRDMQIEALYEEINNNAVKEDSIYSLNLMLDMLQEHKDSEIGKSNFQKNKGAVYNRLKELLVHG